MPIPSSLTDGLKKLEPLTDDTWVTWSKTMIMFFHGCGATWITNGTSVPEGKEGLDGELVWTIYSHVHENYKNSIEDETSGLAAWKILKGKFEKSTRPRRIAARNNFYRAEHDPSLPISVFLDKADTARKVLKNFNDEPNDVQTADVILMNLHSSWDLVRTIISSSINEHKLADVKGILLGTTVTADNPDFQLGLAAREDSRSGGRYGGAGRGNGHGGHGGGNGYGGSGAGGGNSGGGGGAPSRNHTTDDKGYHWCNPTNENHCHRCGRPGHIAARCIHDMPRHIKDWVMDSAPRAHVASESAHNARHWDDGNSDDDNVDKDFQHLVNATSRFDIQAPLRI